MSRQKTDMLFLGTVITLTVVGFLVFISGSYGTLTRSTSLFAAIAFNQFFLGLFMGSIFCFVTSHIKFTFWRKYAFYIFCTAIVVNLLVFVPGLGLHSGGASRWIQIGSLSFQPSELLKIAFVIYFATWVSGVREKIGTIKFGTLPFLIILGVVASILLLQRDTDTFLVIAAAGFAMFVAAGGRWRHILSICLIGIVALGGVVMLRPYVLERVKIFLDPSQDALGAGYQIQQSLIAVGSGQVTGRGFGQSIQKFKFLPESIGDSIYAVAAEEFGFIGASLIIILFLFFVFRGLRIALVSPDIFSGLTVVGVIILVSSQAFVNIGAMIAVLPLSGIPLPFFSHGGTALFFTLAEMGIVLNISRFRSTGTMV